MNISKERVNALYRESIEKGYSKQAPQGMSEPTIEFIREYIYNETGVKV
jgi:hypothetical protein